MYMGDVNFSTRFSESQYMRPEGPELPWWLPLSIFTWGVQMISYHVFGFIFELCDRSSVVATSRIKVRKRDRKSYAFMMPMVLCNQFLVLLPCMYFTEWAGYCFSGAPHLELHRFLISLPTMALLHDIVQYVTHRFLLHSKNAWMVRLLRHTVHHSTVASCGISACYMSMPDFFLEIVLPYLIPLALVGGGGTDVVFHSLVAASGAFGGIYEHSGYDLSVLVEQEAATTDSKLERKPNAFNPRSFWRRFLINGLTTRAHREHHSRTHVSFSDGFGSPGACDTLFETRFDLVPTRLAAEQEWQTQRAQLAATDRED